MVIDGFILTASGIMLPLLLYLKWDVTALELCPAIAVMSPVFRWLLIYEPGQGYSSIMTVVPDIFFYIAYGIVFYMIYNGHFKGTREIKSIAAAAFFSDLTGNIIEVSIRVYPDLIPFKIIQSLIAIAVIRTFILIGILVLINSYSGFLNRMEHERKYRNLTMLASKLKSEIYFMHRNMDKIESVMNKSFTAYKLSREHSENPGVQELLLDVAKDVHEFKKDYIRVINVVESLYPQVMEISSLTVREIVKLIDIHVKDQYSSTNGRVYINYAVYSDAIIHSHYYFISILNNLIFNAIEASSPDRINYVNLDITEENDDLRIVVADTGTGIDPEHMSCIFNPGFSTKFDEETGDISRGIGLTLVKSLVETNFLGQMNAASRVGEGTTFTLLLPLSVLGGQV